MSSVRAFMMLLALLQPADDWRDRPAEAWFTTFAFRSKLVGVASFYGKRQEGRTMANGQPYRTAGLTAASRSLPLGLMVRVTNLRNNRHVVVRITDRGPYLKGRLIDLSLAAARQLRIVGPGLAPVWIALLDDARVSTPRKGRKAVMGQAAAPADVTISCAD